MCEAANAEEVDVLTARLVEVATVVAQAEILNNKRAHKQRRQRGLRTFLREIQEPFAN